MSPLVRVVLFVFGILAVVVGIIYVVEPVHSLPSFFPGHFPRAHPPPHPRIPRNRRRHYPADPCRDSRTFPSPRVLGRGDHHLLTGPAGGSLPIHRVGS
jgi:hypothetical protein